jgi:ABC-type phosphate transport system substrate-binding protein
MVASAGDVVTRVGRRSPLRLLGTIALAAAAGLLTMAVALPDSSATAANAPQLFVELHGEGAWSMYGERVQWQNELVTAPSYVDLNYISDGSATGRQNLIDGSADFAVSGVPFQPGEVAGVQGGASAFIDAPIEVATMATFVEPMFVQKPQAAFISVSVICDPDDETTWPPNVTTPDGCVVRAPYTGPVRIPNRNLAAMFLHYAGTTTPRLWSWNNPDVLWAFGIDPATAELQNDSIEAGPGIAGRSDPDEISYYMQQFIKQGAPDIWQGRIDLDRRILWEPITERMPAFSGVTRDGAEQQVEQLAWGGCSVRGTCTPTETGGLAPAPPSMLSTFKSAFPKQVIALAEMQNANGDWVGPTSASINKAVDAGGDSPLYALTHKVSGAYPVVWVDHFYAPAHGLSIAKTEGLAALIRYLATTGQEKAASVGEGRLPAPLVAKALAAADQLVKSNCIGADRVVVSSSDPGPLAPPTATAMRSIGTALHCEPVASPSSTVLSSTSTTTPLLEVPVEGVSEPPNGSVNSAGANTSSNPTGAQTAPASADGSSDVVVVRSRKAALVTTSKLPLPIPGGASGTDRLATFLLGALLFLLLRKPATRLSHRVAR